MKKLLSSLIRNMGKSKRELKLEFQRRKEREPGLTAAADHIAQSVF